MLEFLENLELVAQTAGFSYFSEIVSKETKKKNILHYHLPQIGLKAYATRTDEGFTVIEGSEASANVTAALSKGYASLRDELIDTGVLVETDGGKLVFTSDCSFKSPSAAAAIIAGGPRSGPENWKDEAGVTLRELLQAEESGCEESESGELPL